MGARAFRCLAVTAIAVILSLCAVPRCRAASCPALAEASNRVQEEGKAVHPFDEFVGLLGECDLGARLDNFAIELQNTPKTKGYIIVYSGKYDQPARISTYRARIGSYLINTRGVVAERLVITDGGYRQEMMTALWIVPKNAPAPEPAATINVNRELDQAFKFDQQTLYFIDDAEPFTEDVEPLEEVTDEPAVDEAAADQSVEVPAETAEASGQTEEAQAETAETQEETVDEELLWASEDYARALGVEAKARGYIIFYADRERADFARMQAVIERGKLQLSEKYGVRAERLTAVFGGYRKSPTVEVWIVPVNVSLPVPTPEPEPEEKADERVNQAAAEAPAVP